MGKSDRQSYLSNNPLKGHAYRQAGFTLIELLVVIAVIGVLATVLIVVIDPVKQLQRARDTKRKADVAKIQQALEMYRSDTGGYPDATSLQNCGDSVDLQNNGVKYLTGVPCDPTTNSAYLYTPDSNTPPISYTIVACLENSSDSQADKTKDSSCSTPASYTQTNP